MMLKKKNQNVCGKYLFVVWKKNQKMLEFRVFFCPHLHIESCFLYYDVNDTKWAYVCVCVCVKYHLQQKIQKGPLITLTFNEI